jgi:nucleoside-diphosphate-sugar epimerase
MTRVLLTGGSGFIAAHVLEQLLKRGHSVVTTVRSQDKADKIKSAHSSYGKDKLETVIVEDIAKEDAFDKVVKSDPPFEAVIHTASPFHFNVTDIQKELLDPAVIGTTGILKSIKKSAPEVKRVVITSSFAAIINPSKGNWPEHTYSEEDWDPLTHEEALENPTAGYRASKTFAEKAAWDFVEKEKPGFTIATINPPLVFGPIVHYLNSLSALNTSNERFRNFIQGQLKGAKEIPPSGVHIWVDVRDVAQAHVEAMERSEAGSKRFFVVAGYYSNRELLAIIRKNFPEYKEQLPAEDATGGDYPPAPGIFKIDNSRSKDVLGLKYRSLEEAVVDTVRSLKGVGA